MDGHSRIWTCFCCHSSLFFWRRSLLNQNERNWWKKPFTQQTIPCFRYRVLHTHTTTRSCSSSLFSASTSTYHHHTHTQWLKTFSKWKKKRKKAIYKCENSNKTHCGHFGWIFGSNLSFFKKNKIRAENLLMKLCRLSNIPSMAWHGSELK